MQVEEKVLVEEAITEQRIGMTRRTVIATRQKKRDAEGQSNTVPSRVVKAKMVKPDMRGVIKWRRSERYVPKDSQAAERHGGGSADSSSAAAGDASTLEAAPVAYASRQLMCPACGHPKETAHMQLRTIRGYRDLHCARCTYHGRCGWHRCQCDVAWARCAVH